MLADVADETDEKDHGCWQMKPMTQIKNISVSSDKSVSSAIMQLISISNSNR